MYWVLAHEVGHQIHGDTRVDVAAPTASRKKMEAAADEFAARALVRMGYSVYPTVFLMEYFAAIEQPAVQLPMTILRLFVVWRMYLAPLGLSEKVRPSVARETMLIDNGAKLWTNRA
jgi:hypothetical protein